MDANRIKLFYHTLKHVKSVQLYYQVYYKFLGRFFKPKLNRPFNSPDFIKFNAGVINYISFSEPNTFKFLNLEQRFDTIDWNFNTYGKLWTYNLNYFDFLNQEKMDKETGLNLIIDFCNSNKNHLDAYEPYPISLRGINWVTFLSRYEINDSRIHQQLYNDFIRLEHNLEYHILANHLIENAFSLLFGAYYFQDERLYKRAKKLLVSQLEEQVLSDGAHYELSPMYHSIMLHRVLDCYNLVSNNPWKKNELADLFYNKASIMLGWLQEIQFDNGDLPMVNDATKGIAPKPIELFEYAKRLHIKISPIQLKESGYRKLKTKKFEVLFDVGQIAPSYQPGHSHADSLQIVVHANGTPLIVDTGISTYEKNERRHLERSTYSHNTVIINNENSSQVWSGFRVAKRAYVKIIDDKENQIKASHNGYRAFGITHSRALKSINNKIEITDTLKSTKTDAFGKGHLHLHPDVSFQLNTNSILLNETVEIQFSKEAKLELENYMFCNGFNDLVPSKKLSYSFNNQVTFSITHL